MHVVSLILLVVAFAKCQLTKEKEFAYITSFSSNVYKTTLHSYISAMLYLALKSLLFFRLDTFEP